MHPQLILHKLQEERAVDEAEFIGVVQSWQKLGFATPNVSWSLVGMTPTGLEFMEKYGRLT